MAGAAAETSPVGRLCLVRPVRTGEDGTKDPAGSHSVGLIAAMMTRRCTEYIANQAKCYHEGNTGQNKTACRLLLRNRQSRAQKNLPARRQSDSRVTTPPAAQGQRCTGVAGSRGVTLPNSPHIRRSGHSPQN